jgi:hypothetical protein
VTIRRDKSAQGQVGRQVPVAFGARPETCPVRALAVRLKAAGTIKGPLFRAVDRHGNVSSRALEPCSIVRILKKAPSLPAERADQAVCEPVAAGRKSAWLAIRILSGGHAFLRRRRRRPLKSIAPSRRRLRLRARAERWHLFEDPQELPNDLRVAAISRAGYFNRRH